MTTTKLDIKETFAKFADNQATFVECFDAFFDAIGFETVSASTVPMDFREMYLAAQQRDDMPQYLEKIYQNIKNTYFCGAITDEFFVDKKTLEIDFAELSHKDYDGFMLFGVELDPAQHYTRTDVANLTRGLNKLSHARPVIAFIRNGDLLSIATCERIRYVHFNLEAQRGERALKVSMLHNINLRNPHRGHLDIIETMQFGDCQSFNELYDKWQEVFSVETLTKNFYNQIYNWYIWALDEKTGVYFPSNPETDADDRDKIDEKIIRLITRIIFVWFLKQKTHQDGSSLIPSAIFDTEKIAAMLRDFDPVSRSNGNYYNTILQNLFFATLNKPINERGFVTHKTDKNNKTTSEQYGIKTFFRDMDNTPQLTIPEEDFVRLMSSVPYLNGGLFECLDKVEGKTKQLYDGFSCGDRRFTKEPCHYKTRAFVPNVLFFGSEKEREITYYIEGKPVTEIKKVSGLIPLLRKFHFTIQENTPIEQDISLDPELLGKVFENLLGAYNPETKDTVRKSTGSYYTPNKVVTYMVNQSIISIVESKCPGIDTGLLRQILDYELSENPFDDTQSATLINAIYHCKVLDPACGSGAFPMGILQQLVHLLNVLDPMNTLWQQSVRAKSENDKQEAINRIKEKATQRISDALSHSKDSREQEIAEITRTYDEQIAEINRNFADQLMTPDYWRKLYVIQNCVYGVDIQPVAMSITKLRFFISLIVDQKLNDLADDNYGVKPLPNLETKFVCANTLIPAAMKQLEKDRQWTLGLGDETLTALKNQLFALREQHFYVRNTREKSRLRQQDRAKRKEISDHIIRQRTTPDQAAIDGYNERIQSAKQEMQSVKQPKYELREIVETGDLFGNNKNTRMVRVDANKERRDTLKSIITNNEIALQKELSKAGNDKALEAAADQIASWDPYDQNAKADFFDAEFMFNVKEGFDIVIGNPPYGANIDVLTDTYKKIYPKTSHGFKDIYKYFYDNGLRLLKENGIISFITPSTFLRQPRYRDLRQLMLENRIIQLLDLGETVFESAVVPVAIAILMKSNKINTIRFVDLTKTLTKNNAAEILKNPKFKIIQQKNYNETPNNIFIENIIKCTDNQVLLDEILSFKDAGINYQRVNVGLHQKGKSDLSTRLLYEGEKEKTTDIEFWKGCDIDSFFIKKHTNRFCRPDIKLRAGEHVTLNSEYFSIIPKLMWRQTAQYPIVTIDNEGHWFGRSIQAGIIKEEYSKTITYEYLCALLNSKYLRYLYEQNVKETGRVFPQVKLEKLKPLPIVVPTPSQQTPIIRLVEEILCLKASGADTTAQEREIDRLVYQLYGLTDEEIKVVEGK